MRVTLGAAFLLAVRLTLAQADMPKPAYDLTLPREQRIKLAESAAPLDISGKATVYLLERSGYIKVRDGTNGFSCIVDRQTPWNSRDGTARLPARHGGWERWKLRRASRVPSASRVPEDCFLRHERRPRAGGGRQNQHPPV